MSVKKNEIPKETEKKVSRKFIKKNLKKDLEEKVELTVKDEPSREPLFTKESLNQEVESTKSFTPIEPVLDLEEKPKKIIKRKNIEEQKLGKTEEEKLKEGLMGIYENDDGSMPNMKQFQTRKKSSFAMAILVLLFSCLFLGSVAWAGLFIWTPKETFQEDQIFLAVSGEDKAVVGQEVQYRIRYRNDQNVPLSKAVLQVRYPEGFIFEKSSQNPTNENNDEWALGSINPGDSGYIDIFGQAYGNLAEKKSFRIFLNYTPANFSSEFQKVTNFMVEFFGSPVELKVAGPVEAVPGAKVDYKISVNKISAVAIKNLALIIETPKEFNKSVSKPESDKDNTLKWSFLVLSENKEILFGGAFSSEVTDTSTLIFKVVGWKDDKRNSDPYIFAVVSSSVKISKNELGLSLAINGSLNDSSVVPGDTLNATVNIKNNGQTIIKNAVVDLGVVAPSYNSKSILDWAKIEDPSDGQISGKQKTTDLREADLSWNSSKIKELAVLKPGDEVSIDFHLPIKNSDVVDLTQFVQNKINVLATLSYNEGTEKKSLSSNPVNLVINSDLGFEVKDDISTSNGKETHKLTWMLSNSYHELKNIQLEAEIYGDITFNKDLVVVPAGKINFDDKEKKLTWQIDSMPTSLDILALQYTVVLNTKNSSQTNLTSKVRIKATDTITNQEIIKAGDEVLLK